MKNATILQLCVHLTLLKVTIFKDSLILDLYVAAGSNFVMPALEGPHHVSAFWIHEWTHCSIRSSASPSRTTIINSGALILSALFIAEKTVDMLRHSWTSHRIVPGGT